MPAPRSTAPATDLTPSVGLEFISMQRLACYGSCPVYDLFILTDGGVLYQGEEHVAAKGLRHVVLSPQALASLRAAIERSGFMSTDEDCCRSQDTTDQPSVNLTVSLGGVEKTIFHYLGSKQGHNLKALENEIDEIVGTDRWIEPPDD